MTTKPAVRKGIKKVVKGLEKRVETNIVDYTPSDSGKNKLAGATVFGIGSIALNLYGGLIGDIASVATWAVAVTKGYQAYLDGILYLPRPEKGKLHAFVAIGTAAGSALLNWKGGPGGDLVSIATWAYASWNAYKSFKDYSV